MATTLGTSDLGPLTTVRRTWRTTIESARNQPVTITAHREEILQTADGEAIKQNQNAGVVTRSLDDVYAETVTLEDGTVISGLQAALAVEAFLERWDDQDRAPAEPEPELEA